MVSPEWNVQLPTCTTRKEFVTRYTSNMTSKAPNTYERNTVFLAYFFLCLPPAPAMSLFGPLWLFFSFFFLVLFVIDHFLPLYLLSARPRPTYGVCVAASFGEKKNEVNIIMLRRSKNHLTASFL